MAKDDYYVIVYQILAYLYRCLKDDEKINPEMLMWDSPIIKINKNYWSYIMEHMLKENYIENAFLTYAMGHVLVDADLSECMITPKGIEYLCENSTIKKAYRFLKEVKSITPFELL